LKKEKKYVSNNITKIGYIYPSFITSSFVGKGQKKYVSTADAAAAKAAAKEAKKRDRLAAKLHNVEQWGGKLGYTEDHQHYHDPRMAQGEGFMTAYTYSHSHPYEGHSSRSSTLLHAAFHCYYKKRHY
jgi:hypothetical protein